jgi:RHS repeat-associated protein
MPNSLPSFCRSRSTGKERDSESGLDYFGARYYASDMGRWMSPDWAAKPVAVPYAQFGSPQTLNLYAYVANNPVANRDADGHICIFGIGHCNNDPPLPAPTPSPTKVLYPPPKPQLDKSGNPGPPKPPSTPQPAPMTYKAGVPRPASDSDLGKMLACTNTCVAPAPMPVTSTSEAVPGHPEIHQPDSPHGRGEAADVAPGKDEAHATLMCAATCGSGFAQNEYSNPSPHATGPHIHLQTTEGKNGSSGDLPDIPDELQ